MTLPGAGKILNWTNEFAHALLSHKMGWLPAGLAAAVFVDLGFQPRLGPGLFQLISAPGLFAHGIELANKPLTSMPFINDENYVIEGISNEKQC
jgi:citrate synthase